MMPSTFTWLDYSEHERRKMLDVIELFGERTTRDELGLGGVRDALADLFFPGTSTIQTRARYFLFVPWGYLALEQKRTRSSDIAGRARKLETELMQSIAASRDSSGLIGRVAKENIVRLASSVYWQGLLVWGIRLFPGSQQEYHRSLDGFYIRCRTRQLRGREYEGEGTGEREPPNWHPGLPQPPAAFPQSVTFTLQPHEAEYLRERVLTCCSRSLLAYLLREKIPVKDVAAAWDLADQLPESLREPLRHGRNFSELMHGAQLLYNLMLAELRDWQEKVDEYRGLLAQWWQRIAERRSAWQAWDRERFWQIVYRQNPRVSARARKFIDRWVELVGAASECAAVVEGTAERQWIALRESQLKGGLARLHNVRARELWAGAAGAAQLDLRWRSAQRIIADILDGLEGDHA